MKKTLIAMAVLAVSGASFAQTNVAITGTLAMGYQQKTNVGQLTAYTGVGTLATTGLVSVSTLAAAGGDSSGFGVDTSYIEFTAKEDLGGGQSIEAKLGLGGLDRSGESTGGPAYGGDAYLTYTNKSFGRIQLGTDKGGAVHSGIPSVGAPVINMDGKLFQKRTSGDFISYAAPIGPVVVLLKLSEPGNGDSTKSAVTGVSTPAGSGGLGLGVGTAGGVAGVPGTAGTAGQRTTDLAGIYTSGPLQLLGAYRTYDNRDDKAINGTYGLTKDNVVAFAASYDIGVAKLGLGYNTTTTTVGPKVADMLLGVNVPMGALTVGMTLSRATTSGISDVKTALAGGIGGVMPVMSKADGTANGMSLGAKYDLSKRTNLTVNYATWTRSGYEQFEAFQKTGAWGEFGYKDNMSEANILLSHSF